MRSILIAVLSFCLMCGVVWADGAVNTVTGNQESPVVNEESGIPNYALEGINGNGRPQHMDATGDKEGEELNPVERRIIVRDAIISNRANPSNPAGQ